jgi:predicted ATPase/class 3 adenylate cyclase
VPVSNDNPTARAPVTPSPQRNEPGGGSGNDHSVRRSHACILFSDLCASTHLGEVLDPETLAEVLHEVRAAAEQVVGRHRGVVNQFYGDGILAVFGFPEPAEGDARRAIEAALELHRAVRELPLQRLLPANFSVRLHSGVHAGLVAAQQGDFVQGRYRLTGDALNTAQRLATCAASDDIVASTSSLQGTLEFFVAEALPPLMLKGKHLPMGAYRVLRRSAINRVFEARVCRGLSPFTGRRPELRSLDRGLQDALRGKLQLVSVVGNAGLGKTRLVEEFLREQQSEQFRLHRAYCQSDGGAIPLQPFVQILQHLLAPDLTAAPSQLARQIETQIAGIFAGEFPDEDPPQPKAIAQELLSLLITTGSATPKHSHPVATVALLLRRLASTQPQVIFIDDWHDADDTSRQVISELLLAARDCPILILATARALDPIDPLMGGSLLQLSPFGFDESKKLINKLFPRHPEIGTVARIHERAGGNALFIEELCQSLLAHSDGCHPMLCNVPNTLYELVEARVNRLQKPLLELVRTAAVIGNFFSRSLLERLIGRTLDCESLEALVGADLIYQTEDDDSLRFKHGITREVVYASVPLQQRRQLHLRAATLLEQDMVAGIPSASEALAYHFEGAGEPQQAILYAERAGDRALMASSLDAARQHYFQALQLLKAGDTSLASQQQWVSISARWALACTYSPAPNQLEILEQTAQYANALKDAVGYADAQYWMGWINYALGDQRASIAHYRKALAIAKKMSDAKTTTQIMMTLGQSYAAAGDYPQALALLSEAIAIKEQHRSARASAPVGSAFGKACKAFVLADMGEFDTAIMLIESAVAGVQDHNQAIEASILNIYGAILLWRGDWHSAFDVAHRAQRVAERVNGPYVFAMSQAVQSYARWMMVRGTDALDALQQATEWLEQQQMCLFISLCYGWLADAMATDGNYAQAKKYAFAALQRAETSDRLGAAMACRALATVAIYDDDPQLQSARYYLDMAMQFARQRQSVHEIAVTQLQTGMLLMDGGENKKADMEKMLAQASTAFETMGMESFLSHSLH